jgi:hypothetical protein
MPQTRRTISMKLPIAIAALFLAATTALPAAAAAPTGRSFYQHQGRSLSTHHDQGPYRSDAARNAYAAAPGYAAAPRGARQPAANGWGHCVSGLASEGYSAYPSWDVC